MKYITKISLTINFKIVVLSFVVEAIDDFAGLLTAEKRNLYDQEKFQLLTKDYTPSEEFVFPKTKIYGMASVQSFQRRGPLSSMSCVSTKLQCCEHWDACEFCHDKI